MWIYYYASFGPGHQSHDYGFKHFHDSYDMEDIKDHLFDYIDSCGYSIVLNFWEVAKPPSNYVRDKIKETKEKIKNLKKYLRSMQEQSVFVSVQEEKSDPVLIRNISRCVIHDMLERLHKAGFMYGADDISDWRYGKRCLVEPHRSKVLSIMRRSKKYPDPKKQLLEKKK
jgi:hypothetical protein